MEEREEGGSQGLAGMAGFSAGSCDHLDKTEDDELHTQEQIWDKSLDY